MFVQEKNTDPSIRFRVDDDLKDAWEAFCDRKKITQIGAMTALMRFVMQQDDVFASMIFGQIAPSKDLIELAMKRMMKGK